MKENHEELVKEYREGKTDRRTFMKRLVIATGSVAAAMSWLSLSQNSLIASEILSDNEIIEEMIFYPGDPGVMRAHMARPAVEGKFPAVIVIHENRGLVPHIKDVNRRMAKEGFLSLAPDGNSPLGGTPDDESVGMARLREIDTEAHKKNFIAAVEYLKNHPLSNGNVGCTGFCWGGAMTNHVAVNSPDLKAAVPWYGSVPEEAHTPSIKAAVMAHYAENDQRINTGIEGFKEAMEKAGIEHQIFIYPGTAHGFNNDTNSTRYAEEAARLAWERTIKFFREKLQG